MTPDDALARLRAAGDPARATKMAAYHKTDRTLLGVPGETLNEMAKTLRGDLTVDARCDLAQSLWTDGTFEARLLAAKLLTQARLCPDDRTWSILQSWLPDFDGWAIADTACGAIARRLTADPARLDTVETWTTSDHLWTKRAALVATLPWAKQRHPTAEEAAARARILTWAAAYVPDRNWFIQKAIAWWLRDLSRRDPAAVRAFLATHAPAMKPFAAKEAARLLPD
ncbi:MAG: DNA alkylation repair protein [Pseudomonadota bacterium]